MRRYLVERIRIAVDALEHLVGGLGTAVLALAALISLFVALVLCIGGVGIFMIPAALRTVRSSANRERHRLSRWGPEILGPPELPDRTATAIRDLAVRRELLWVLVHATVGFSEGIVGLTLPVTALQSVTFPFWYTLVPPEAGGPGLVSWRIDG